jgi:hypothetical protein
MRGNGTFCILDVKGVMTDTKQRAPNKHLVGVLVFLVCLCGSYLLLPAAHYYRGKLEAYRDIAYGNYKFQSCVNECIAVKTLPDYERLIIKYANIRIETAADCGYRMHGYNEVQWCRIERLYPGAYERAFTEALELERSRVQSLEE